MDWLVILQSDPLVIAKGYWLCWRLNLGLLDLLFDVADLLLDLDCGEGGSGRVDLAGLRCSAVRIVSSLLLHGRCRYWGPLSRPRFFQLRSGGLARVSKGFLVHFVELLDVQFQNVLHE